MKGHSHGITMKEYHQYPFPFLCAQSHLASRPLRFILDPRFSFLSESDPKHRGGAATRGRGPSLREKRKEDHCCTRVDSRQKRTEVKKAFDAQGNPGRGSIYNATSASAPRTRVPSTFLAIISFPIYEWLRMECLGDFILSDPFPVIRPNSTKSYEV